MIGTVQKKEFNKNGTPKFQISGTWYFLNRSVQNEFPPGTSVEFEFEEFGEDRGRGRPKAITKWRQAQQGGYAANPHQGGQSVAHQPATTTVTDVDILRSVSNVVGSACAAGTVKDPVELEKWFVAAWAGFTRRTKAMNGKTDPQFDDDLPEGFYAQSENPAPNDGGSTW